jgi:RHS repeat-associated protein
MKTVTANDTNFTNYEYNSDNQLLYYTTNGSDTISFTYDDNGNQTHIAHSSSLILDRNYQYDYENNLITVDNDSDVITYIYSPDGKRLRKYVNGVGVKYFYEGDNVLTEYDTNTTVQVRYTNNLQIDDIISAERNSVSEWYHKDALGSVTDLTDNNEDTTISYVYNEFGTITSTSGSSENQMTYTGRRYDKEAGLYYYRSRYYNSMTGRFTQKDKAGFVDGPNLYIYVKNNSINFGDPSGKCVASISYTAWIAVKYVVVPVGGFVLIKYAEYRYRKTKNYINDCGSCKLDSISIHKENRIKIHRKLKKKCPPCPIPPRPYSRLDKVPPSVSLVRYSI